MPTDAERREVARRLRKAVGLHEFAEVLGFDWTDESDWAWKDVSNLVADLIEPSGYECVPGECPLNVCHDNDLIDRDALLALADEMDDACPESASVAIGYIDDYARRIRDALGVIA